MKLASTNWVKGLKFSIKASRMDCKVIRARASNQIRFLGLAWCNPMTIKTSTRYFVAKQGGYLKSNSELAKEVVHKRLSQFIVEGEWDHDVTPIEDVKSISRTEQHYTKQLSWEQVGEVDWMMRNIKRFGVQDGCHSYKDVMNRCKHLDELKQHLEAGGQFATQQELNPQTFREMGGIGIAVGRHGDIIWFDNGAHRLAIARHLLLPEIPICLQLIHPEAIKQGKVFSHLTAKAQFR